jgi:hypothetical protein
MKKTISKAAYCDIEHPSIMIQATEINDNNNQTTTTTERIYEYGSALMANSTRSSTKATESSSVANALQLTTFLLIQNHAKFRSRRRSQREVDQKSESF